MSMSEREKLVAVLFGDTDRQVLNVKFLRGVSSTPEEMCAAARGVLEDFRKSEKGHVSKLPTNGRLQRTLAEIIATY